VARNHGLNKYEKSEVRILLMKSSVQYFYIMFFETYSEVLRASNAP
jgi:hypothetical protein